MPWRFGNLPSTSNPKGSPLKSLSFTASARSLATLLLFTACLGLRAEFLQPTAVRVTNGEASQDYLIDGQGLDDAGLGSPNSTHNREASQMWSGIGSIRESATFDLGKSVNLTKVYIWNYNVPDATDVGMKDVEVQVSAETDLDNPNAVFNTIARIALKEGGDKAQSFDVVGTGVRLVRLKGLSNWGQGYTVGLAEVRFESGDISGNVPSIVTTSPREGDEIAFGTDIVVDARITDKDLFSDIAKIELFDNDILITNRVVTAFTATIRGAAKGDHALRLLATDKSGKVAWVTINVTVRELVADRIVKIDDTADEGTGLNQIRYEGSWNLAPGNASDPRYKNNDHYNLGTGRTDYFEVRFQGVKIDLFATVASHHGTGMASIDGGPEVKVIYRATQRKEQVFVWGSPILSNREHVLKVRVFGDGVVTADRFDISVSDKPDQATATIKSVAFNQVAIEMKDVGTSIVDAATVKLSLNGSAVPATVSKSAGTTTVIHSPSTPFPPGAVYLAKLEAKDMAGAILGSELTFTLPAPYFPLEGLNAPNPTAGNWGLRQIWSAGRADAVASAAELAAQAVKPGFAGQLHDTQVPFLNLALSSNPGGGGLFPDDAPFPAEARGLTPSDFVIVAHARVRIPRSGDWTLGVHSDDGFALRFVGAPFDSVNGAGARNDDFPEYMAHLTETGNSNTRGILKGIAAGEYGIEFLGFQRVAGAFCEIYAAEGAFQDDSETDAWRLVGGPEGLELVAPPAPAAKLTIQRLTRRQDEITIDFESTVPDRQHQLHTSADLKSWQLSGAATFQKTGSTTLRATLRGASAPAAFYRLTVDSR